MWSAPTVTTFPCPMCGEPVETQVINMSPHGHRYEPCGCVPSCLIWDIGLNRQALEAGVIKPGERVHQGLCLAQP